LRTCRATEPAARRIAAANMQTPSALFRSFSN
jgi:hypothetical protein